MLGDSPTQLGILIVGAIGVGFTLGYYPRGDRIETLETNLDSYQSVEKMDISALTEKLVEANATIESNLKDIAKQVEAEQQNLALKIETDALKEDLGDTKKELAALVRQNNEISTENNSLKAQLSSYYPQNEEFRLAEGDSRGLGGFEAILGLQRVSSSDVEVNYNNERQTLRIGNYIDVNVRDLSCKLILKEVSYYGAGKSALFGFVCSKIEPGGT